MHDFLIKEIKTTQMEDELLAVGFDGTYVPKAVGKFFYKNLKIFNLSVAQANILKQTALSVGADCATHKDVITGKIENSSCILGGSYSQIRKIAEKLQFQPFQMKDLGKILLKECDISVEKPETKIVGVLNITRDSFSDGGMFYEFEESIEQLNKLIDDGADVIDIGAESTKPGFTPVSPEAQLEKLLPVLEYINDNDISIPISIDTRSSIVAKECIESGASIINDVSGLTSDADMAEVVARYPDVKVIIQHTLGLPYDISVKPHYDNLMDEIFLYLAEKVNYAVSKGISREDIIIDPGIGFGKLKSHNLEIINRWQELKAIGCPVMIGLSRKSLLECPDAENDEKDIYTLALDSILINQGIDYLRVHNPALHRKIISILK